MQSIIIKTKDELIKFTNLMEEFYTNIIDYICVINEQLDNLIKDDFKFKDIENLLNIFIISLNILIGKQYDTQLYKKVYIELNGNIYTKIYEIPKYRIKFYKKKLIGKIEFIANENITFLIGNKIDNDIIDINLLKQNLIIIKKRILKLYDFFINKNSELLLYFNNIIMIT